MKEEKKNRLDTKSSVTIVLGVFVCFFVIAIYAVANRLDTSYALTINDIDAADIDTITTKTEVGLNNDQGYKPDDATAAWKNLSSKFKGEITSGGVKYIIDMFCLEEDKEMPGANETYTKKSDSSIIDEGITYIVNTAYKNVEATDATDGSKEIKLDLEDYYNAQMAIWIYQKLAADSSASDAMWAAIKTNHASGNAKVIYDYVVNAQLAESSDATNSITLSTGNPELKLSDDKSYYETDLLEISVTTAPNTTFGGFKFQLDGSNYNTTVVGEDGATITDYSTLQNKKFKIRVDASTLAAGSKANISGDFSGVFTHYTFLAYQEGSAAQIALLATNTKAQKTVPLELNISVPDTGVDYSQYIYIIGAMVLVIGLSVIYVNTKARES